MVPLAPREFSARREKRTAETAALPIALFRRRRYFAGQLDEMEDVVFGVGVDEGEVGAAWTTVAEMGVVQGHALFLPRTGVGLRDGVGNLLRAADRIVFQ